MLNNVEVNSFKKTSIDTKSNKKIQILYNFLEVNSFLLNSTLIYALFLSSDNIAKTDI